MSVPEPLNPRIASARRLAPKFTPEIRFYHPHLDPSTRIEDLQIIPAALFPGRKLNWELARPAVRDHQDMLKLTDDPDEFLRELQNEIPQIDDVLELWSEVEGAGPRTTSDQRKQAQPPVPEVREGTISDLVSVERPGRADVIYPTDVPKDSGEHAEFFEVPSNLRTTEWEGFDGSYVHLADSADSEPKMTAFPMEQEPDIDDHGMRRNSTPFNLKVTEWLDSEHH